MFAVVRDDSVIVRSVIETHHYLHRYPDPRSLPFAYRLIREHQTIAPDGRPWGVVIFKKPQHHKQVGLFGYPGLITSWQVLDLARVWVHPDLQIRHEIHAACVFSQMVGLALRRVQWDWLKHHPPVFPNLPYHIRLIISYCDLNHHEGTAYRASSFTRIATTSDGTKEVYTRWLKQPKKSWKPTAPMQPPLFQEVDGRQMPIIHS
jgi:hypothetical protein